MANFFSTVHAGLGFPQDEDEDEEMKHPGRATMGILASGPTFVKATQQIQQQQSESDSSSDHYTETKIKVKRAPKARVDNERKAQAKTNQNSQITDSGFHQAQFSQAHADLSQKRKVQKLESQLESAYGKGSKLLMKSGGSKFQLGEGIGKHGQGILNPVQIQMRQAQGGVGFDRVDGATNSRVMLREAEAFAERPKVAEINMDVFDKEGAEQQAKEVKKQK